MKVFDSKLQIGDYDGIIQELILNPDEDDLIPEYEKRHLRYNINYYPLLLDALEKARKGKSFPKVKSDFWSKLEVRMKALNNVFPSENLPDWIINNERLRNILEDERGITWRPGEWESWERSILEIINNTPRAQHVPFFEWCIGQLAINQKRHEPLCTLPLESCPIDQGYQKRTQFFERAIEDIKINLPDFMPVAKKRSVRKIEWLGSQKELAELFIELKKKGWITDFDNDTIKECFTKSHSIQQTLKPAYNTKSKMKEPTYEGVYTSEYEPQFYGIAKNKNPETD